MRPQAMRVFDLCYLGSIVIGAIAMFVQWPVMVAASNAAAAQRNLPPGVAATSLYIAVAISVIVMIASAVLWYFASQRRSNLARWIIVVLALLSVLTLLRQLVAGTAPGFGGVLSVTGSLLSVVAAAILFKRDVRLWFAGDASSA